MELEIEEEIIIEELELDIIVEKIPETDIEIYKGNYNIIPKTEEEQQLETENKYLEKNIIVSKVPYFEVSNIEGTTVYIGSEV